MDGFVVFYSFYCTIFNNDSYDMFLVYLLFTVLCQQTAGILFENTLILQMFVYFLFYSIFVLIIVLFLFALILLQNEFKLILLTPPVG